ncbi:Pycsar system effector family protein [Neolewinella persica]|uniref:Pycsar system effector family protein n=1 Tax=Neolewinella persica TaxID=70998 RepID=UPI00037F3C03|nr:Pycsar system effector family protein [Neolewinella persica]
MQSPFASSLDLQDLADQAERFMLMSYERLPHANVLHNDSWALALGGHAREIALRQPGASPDLPPLARAAALLEACRYWGRPGEILSWAEIIQEFRQWTGPDYLNLHLALKGALPGGSGHQRAEVADVLHDALLAQRLLSGAEGAELAWLESRYANNSPEAGSPGARLASLNGYLNEIRYARFRNGELRRQYQHTHSAVLLDMQRLVDKLTNRIAPPTSPSPAPITIGTPEKAAGEIGENTATHNFQQFENLENGPTRQATQTYFRTVFRNHINLVAMADQKAAIMISVNTLLIGALVTFTSYRNWAETRPEVLLPVGLFTICGLVSLVYAALAARPSGKPQKDENLAFFGFFSTLSRAEFAERMEQQLQDPNALYGMLVNDLHGLGQSLARKYALLRIAFTIFLAGLVVSCLVLAVVILS